MSIHLLMLHDDAAILDPDSPARARLREQAESLIELHVLVPSSKRGDHELVREGNMFIYPIDTSKKWAFLSEMRRVGGEILRERDRAARWLVTAQDPFMVGTVAYLLARRFRLPLHLQVHTDPFSPRWRTASLRHRIEYVLSLFLLTHADAVRVVSERVQSGVRALGVPSSKITKVPIWVDVDHFRATPASFDLHRSYPIYAKIILCIGRLEPEKNVNGLIRAFARVHKAHRDTMLLIVGSGSEKERLVTLARSLDLKNSVVVAPWARDLVSYYKTCDIYVQPSHYEGWGMAVVEALASGAPVIMTDVGCAGEIVRNEDTGLVVRVGSEDELTHALMRLVENNSLRLALSAAGSRAVENCATKRETLELYKASWERAFTRN